MKVQVDLDPVHVKLIDEMVPFFGADRAEALRHIVIDWLATTRKWRGMKGNP